MVVYSYEGRGEGCQEEVNVDVHHRFSPFFLHAHFSSLFYSAPGIPRIIVLLS